MKQSQAGFTMIEMAIALLLIGLLMTLGFQFVETYREQGKLRQTLTEMEAISKYAESARQFGDGVGDNFNRITTDNLFAYLQAKGVGVGSFSTTVPMRNNFDRPYYITTRNTRVAFVETDVDGRDIRPFGVASQNQGNTSRLLMGFKHKGARPFSRAMAQDKRLIYCQGYAATEVKPDYCPVTP